MSKADVNQADSIRHLIRRIRALVSHLPRKHTRKLYPLLILMVAGAMSEVITLGALLPFLTLVANPLGSPLITQAKPMLLLLGAASPERAAYALAGLFVASAIISGIVRLALLWKTNTFVNGTVYQLSVQLFKNVLHESYEFHKKRNSSEIIAAMTKVEILGWSLLLPLLTGAVSMVLALFLVATLIVISPVVAVAAGVGFTGIYMLATRMTRASLRRNSEVIAKAQNARIRAMQEGLGGIRDVLINHSQQTFLASYEDAMAGLRDSRTRNNFFAGAPRFLVEALGVSLIAVLAVVVTAGPGGLPAAIPVLGAIALGAQKLLPLIQQVYVGWSSLHGNRQVLIDVVNLLNSRVAKDHHSAIDFLPFEHCVSLRQVTFSYAEDPRQTIKNLSLDIPRGSRIGIVGETGSGKSTLLDLILGLLEPQSGEILIDDVPLSRDTTRAWQRNIAHVPQDVYLADATIAQNIAFGVRPEDIDYNLVREATEKAALRDVVAALRDGYDTRVGERGFQLSGGQRQRIGIARALYRRATVLVFDEATSALDEHTEDTVIRAVGALSRGLTILVVGHKPSSLVGLDSIVRLENGQIQTSSGPPSVLS